MGENLECTWRKVIHCAISNSMEYRKAEPSVNPEISALLEDRGVMYISRCNRCTVDEAKEIYKECVESSRKQKKADGQYPAWVSIGLILGFISLIMNSVNFIATKFNFLFFVFVLLSISILKVSKDYIRKNKAVHEAAKIWVKNNQNCSIASIDHALTEMEKVFSVE